MRVDDLEAWIGVAKRVPWVPTWSEVGLLALKKAKIESDPRHKLQTKGGEAGMYPAIKAHPFAFGTICEG